MSVQITPKLLKKILAQTQAEQAILCRDEELLIEPDQDSPNISAWKTYVRIHARSPKNARFHLFSPGSEAIFVLIERLSENELLFLTYSAETSIQTLEEEQEKIHTILNQLSDPDPLTEAVLALNGPQSTACPQSGKPSSQPQGTALPRQGILNPYLLL